MALPDPGVKPGSPALQADSLPAELPGKIVSPRLYLCPEGGRAWSPKSLALTSHFHQITTETKTDPEPRCHPLHSHQRFSLDICHPSTSGPSLALLGAIRYTEDLRTFPTLALAAYPPSLQARTSPCSHLVLGLRTPKTGPS